MKITIQFGERRAVLVPAGKKRYSCRYYNHLGQRRATRAASRASKQTAVKWARTMIRNKGARKGGLAPC